MRRPPRPRLTVEVCEDRLAPAVISWISDASGNWTDGSKWDLGREPAAGDEVIIQRPAADPTITINTDIAAVKSIASSERIDLSTFNNPGTLRGRVTLTDGAMVMVASNTANADGVTLSGTIGGRFNLVVRNGLTLNNGTVNGPSVEFRGDQTLGGTGTVTIAGFSNTMTVPVAGSTLTVAPGVTLRGSGVTLGSPVGEGVIRVRGTVEGFGSSNATTTVRGVSFRNTTGTLRAVDGSLLEVRGAVPAGGGTIRVAGADGRVVFGSVSNPATVTGGAVAAVEGGTVRVGGATFDGVTVTGPAQVQTSGTLTARGTFTLNGTLQVGQDSGGVFGAALVFRPDAALRGDGTIRVKNEIRESTVSAEGAVTISTGATVRIRGIEQNPVVTLAGGLRINGTLDLNEPGQTVNVTLKATGGVTNAGTVRVGDNSVLNVTGAFTNTGTVELVAGKTGGTGRVAAAGKLALGGKLRVVVPPGAANPAVQGQRVVIGGQVGGRTGEFASVTVPGGATIGYDGTTAFLRAVNTPPTIAFSTDKVTDVVPGSVVGPIAFTIDDAQTPADQLQLAPFEAFGLSNGLDFATVVFGGSGRNRTVTFTTPRSASNNRSGIAFIYDLTVRVRDTQSGEAFATLGVRFAPVPPTIGAIADKATTLGTVIGPFVLDIRNRDTLAEDVVVTATSDNPAVVPNSKLVVAFEQVDAPFPDRLLTVTPAAAGTAEITVTATNADGLSATRTFTVTVRPPDATNRPPTAADDTARTAARTPVTIDVRANDTDPDGDPLTVSIPTGGDPAVGTLATDGKTLTFTPAAGFSGVAVFDYRVSDGRGGTATATVRVTVAAAPPAAPPVLVGEQPIAITGVRDGKLETTYVNPDGTVAFRAEPFTLSVPVGVRTVVADFTGDGVPDVAVGTGPGVPSQVRVIDGKTQQEVFRVEPFEATFLGGVYLAAGDLDANGAAELVITPDEGGGPRVTIHNGRDFAVRTNFFGIDDPDFRGGARSAVGDVNGDGKGDLLVAAGFGGGPRLAGFDGAALGPGGGPKVFNDFFVFEQTLRNGVFISSGDLDGDGFAEVIAGGGPGGGPRVFALSGKDLTLGQNTEVMRANFFAGDTSSRTGVQVAVKNLDADARADLLTTSDGQVTAFAGRDTPSDGPPTSLSGLTGRLADLIGGLAGVNVG